METRRVIISFSNLRMQFLRKLASLSVLLRLDGDHVEQSGVRNSSPLTKYTAEHWVAHAQDEKVSSCLRKAMGYLFDLGNPYFAARLQLDSISLEGSAFYNFTPVSKSRATPLYYAALYGFQDLVEHLIVNDPNQVNATGGHCVIPLVAALAAGHFQPETAKFLIDNDAHPNVRGIHNMTPPLSAAYNGDLKMVQVLHSNTRLISMPRLAKTGLYYILHFV